MIQLDALKKRPERQTNRQTDRNWHVGPVLTSLALDKKGTKKKVKDPNRIQKQKGKRRKTSKIKKTGILTKQKGKTKGQRKGKYNEKRNQSHQEKRLKELKRKTKNIKKKQEKNKSSW